MVAGNLFQQLYNMVDTAVVGKFVGEDAVAAVGSSFPIVFLSVAVASGLSMGCNVVVSQLFGAGRIHEMKTTISTAIISLSVLGLIIMALGTVFAGPLLQLLGTDPDIMADSQAVPADLLRRSGVPVSVQHPQRHLQRPGGQPNAADLSHDLQPDQHRAGPALCHPASTWGWPAWPGPP